MGLVFGGLVVSP